MNPLSKPLEGRVALVTGGSRGIGKAIVKKLAHAGCQIAINYFNSSDEAEKLSNELSEAGVKNCIIQGNVADSASIKEMMEAFQQHFSQIDILVNNAASGVLKPITEMKLKHWRWCMETNAFSLCSLVKETKHLMSQGSRVLALSSLGSIRAIPNYGFIGASKAALESLVRSLSLELAEEGITVNALSAGVVDTDALKYFPNREQLLETYRKHSLAGRDLLPEDVADAVYLLCLPESQMIRGQVIFVDAGYSILG
jgi:enoyl-[acyl-carrier protein] reductase III